LFRRTDFSKFKRVRRPAPDFSPAFLVALAVLIALGHAVMAVTATTEKSMTSDEIAHLTAGQAYNTFGDFRLQPENGNLPQRWAALPMTLMRAPLPSTSLPSWRTADVWNYGHAFFYEQSVPVEKWLFAGRAMIALFSAATGLLVFFQSRAAFGWRGGFLSLVVFAFSPSFLAHGALATSDVVMTFFFFAAVSAWWRHLEHPGPVNAALSAIVFGLATVAKFSAILLLPMFALMALIWLLSQRGTDAWRKGLVRVARTAAVHLVVAWSVIWIFFGLRFSPFAPALAEAAGYNHGWEWISSGLGWPGPVVFALQKWRLLPDAFLYGFTFVLQFAKQRGAFLNGEHGIHGWVSFFPYTFLVKSTLPFLLLVTTTALVTARRWRGLAAAAVWKRVRPFTPLIVLFVVYWATSLASHLNIGHRHILPVYPVLFVAIGALGPCLDLRKPGMAAAVGALVLWHGLESVRIRPHYLAYFNAIAGGPENGWRHLVDSSLDWGQDLPGLQAWLSENGRGEPVYLSYFGTGDAVHEGIRATMLPTLPDVGPPRPWRVLGPGLYAVSATMLQQVYSPIQGPWTAAREKEYQELRRLEPQFMAFQNEPVRRAELLRDAPLENWTTLWRRYDVLRFARLCYFLRARRPDAVIGYSIFVHRLSDAEVDAVLNQPSSTWLRAVEQALSKSGAK
jgi:4-amino-4-deoxy-L-arabinose transferase-like glycosyltransferase